MTTLWSLTLAWFAIDRGEIKRSCKSWVCSAIVLTRCHMLGLVWMSRETSVTLRQCKPGAFGDRQSQCKGSSRLGLCARRSSACHRLLKVRQQFSAEGHCASSPSILWMLHDGYARPSIQE
eukprot:815795-Amphidinium_carterae.2